jgi:hypothetical protein
MTWEFIFGLALGIGAAVLTSIDGLNFDVLLSFRSMPYLVVLLSSPCIFLALGYADRILPIQNLERSELELYGGIIVGAAISWIAILMARRVRNQRRDGD